MEYFFFEIWIFEKHIGLSEKKPPLIRWYFLCSTFRGKPTLFSFSFDGKMDKEMWYVHILKMCIKECYLNEKKNLGYLRFRQVFRFFLSSGDHGGLFHWLDRIVVGLFVFVAQKASQIGPSKWYQIVYDHLCIGLRVRFFMSSKFKQK